MLFRVIPYLLFPFVIFAGLSACSSDSSENLPGLPEDTLDPKVLGTFPVTQQIDIEADAVVRIEFSELMDIATLESGGIQLFAGREAVQGNIALEERDFDLTFTEIPGIGPHPVTGDDIDIDVSLLELSTSTGRFALDNTYTVKVLDTAKDLAGNIQKEEGDDSVNSLASLWFTVEEGDWKTSQLVDISAEDPVDSMAPNLVPSGNVFDPQVAGNGKGDVFAVWRQALDTNDVNRLFISRYFAEENRLGPANKSSIATANSNIIDSDIGTSVFSPKIAINTKGELAIVWQQSALSGGPSTIWLNVFDGNSWTGALNILENDSIVGGEADSPMVVIDDDSKVHISWRESGVNYTRIRAITYQYLIDPVTMLTSVTRLNNLKTFLQNDSVYGDAFNPQLAIGPLGVAAAVWTQKELGGVAQVFSSRLENDIWSDALRIDIDQAGDAGEPSIAVDGHSDVFAVWQQYDGNRDNIWVNRYATGSWEEAELLEVDNRGDASSPRVTFSVNNQAFVIWHQNKGAGTVAVEARRFDLQNGWLPIETINTGTTNGISMPDVKFDREGNAMAIWVSGDDTSGNILVNRYSNERDIWLGDEQLKGFNGSSQGAILQPLLEDGRMLALWYHFDGTSFRLAKAQYSD